VGGVLAALLRADVCVAGGKSKAEGCSPSPAGGAAEGAGGALDPDGLVAFGQVGRSPGGTDCPGIEGLDTDRDAAGTGFSAWAEASAETGAGAAGTEGCSPCVGVPVENIITVFEGDRAVRGGKAVKTLPHLVHWTETPEGGTRLSSTR
jgi:hypothetical protein